MSQGPTPPPKLATTGCENCREHHQKCDRVIPACGTCQAAGRSCRQTSARFRVAKRPFSSKQLWVKTPRRLSWVDESKAVAKAVANPDDDAIEDSDDEEEPPEPSPRLPRRQKPADASTLQSKPTFRRRRSPGSPTDRFIRHESAPFSPQNGDPDVIAALRARVYLSESVFPLRSESEALLFRHFVQKLSIWLDLCDPRQSFETIVPKRAGTCPVILNAIFALSSRHLSHTSGFDPYASNQYHGRCLSVIRDILHHATSVLDENLFAAIIILRVLEEMEVKTIGLDNHGYLLSIHEFVKSKDKQIEPESLSAAAFWVGLRQEIYSAVTNHKPVRINLVHSLVDRSFAPVDDYAWANRAVVYCADVLNFCFGEESARSSLIWDELVEWGRQWTANLPPSFSPVYISTPLPGHTTIREIWHHHGCHAIGLQHHILAELFLVLFDPRLPRLGERRVAAENQMTERIQGLVRRLCGIGLGNQWSPPSMFTACMAIATFGDHFTNRLDQEAMLNILRTTERDHLRPTESIQLRMIKVWEM